MSNVYCKAPWVSTCYMPSGKFTPCCAWNGKHFDSPEDIIDQLGPIFKQNQAPDACQGACPPMDANNDNAGWRSQYQDYPTNYQDLQIHFLDFRNSNLCNMKCRSCGPGFSTSWAQELGYKVILQQESIDFQTLNLSQCKKIYFAGGESLLNHQHYELLEYLIDQGQDPVLKYSTNLSCLQYKDTHVGELWKHFSTVDIHGSIDAVGKPAEFIRTGTVWEDIWRNIDWIKQQANITLSFSPVISAINVWWVDELFDFIEKNIDSAVQFQPVLANGNEDISIIPLKWRAPLISQFENCQIKNQNIVRAIDILNNVDNSDKWLKFLIKQLSTDAVRNESWFNTLPICKDLYKDIHNFYE
jgi:uncharacterized radical SAM superfamily Fe-S cluster-containing enzyme